MQSSNATDAGLGVAMDAQQHLGLAEGIAGSGLMSVSAMPTERTSSDTTSRSRFTGQADLRGMAASSRSIHSMKLAYQKVQLARAFVDGTLGRLPRPEAIDASLSSVGRPPAIPLLPPGSAVHGGTGNRQQ